MFAATINFKFEFEPVAFIQCRHAGAFDRRDVDKRVGLSVIALDEAKALHCVEELHRAAGLFTGQLTLWSTTTTTAATETAFARRRITVTRGRTIGYWKRFAVNLEIGCRNLPAAIDERKTERLPLGKPGKSGLFDGRDVNEDILATVITDDKAEAFLPVEELYNAGAFADNLCRHAAPGTTAAASESAAATAAPETTAAASIAATESVATAAAKAITAATEAITAAGKTTAITAAATAAFVTETVAFIASATTAITAASLIETHAVPVLSSKSPARYIQEATCTGRGHKASRRKVIMRHASRDSPKLPLLRAKIAS